MHYTQNVNKEIVDIAYAWVYYTLVRRERTRKEIPRSKCESYTRKRRT